MLARRVDRRARTFIQTLFKFMKALIASACAITALFSFSACEADGDDHDDHHHAGRTTTTTTEETTIHQPAEATETRTIRSY
jgi:hypothetical protein